MGFQLERGERELRKSSLDNSRKFALKAKRKDLEENCSLFFLFIFFFFRGAILENSISFYSYMKGRTCFLMRSDTNLFINNEQYVKILCFSFSFWLLEWSRPNLRLICKQMWHNYDKISKSRNYLINVTIWSSFILIYTSSFLVCASVICHSIHVRNKTRYK